MERAIIADGKVLAEQTLEALDQEWRAAKKRVG
jgi:hypothetical protein